MTNHRKNGICRVDVGCCSALSCIAGFELFNCIGMTSQAACP